MLSVPELQYVSARTRHERENTRLGILKGSRSVRGKTAFDTLSVLGLKGKGLRITASRAL